MEKLKGTKAHQRYHSSDGTLLPGVTTIIGQLDKPALIAWAWRLGMAGEDYKKYRDITASVGTAAHLMVQCHLQNTTPDLSVFAADTVDKAENGFLKFLEWEKHNPISPILLETPLVSEHYSYGGTIDCYCDRYVNGKPEKALIDFKTGSGIWPEMIYQCAAYKNLLTENVTPVDRVFILRIGRDESEGFEERELTNTETGLGLKIFEHLLELYQLQKQIKGGYGGGKTRTRSA